MPVRRVQALSNFNPFRWLFTRRKAQHKGRGQIFAFVLGFLLPLAAMITPAQAQGISLLQDTETYRYLRKVENPILKVAGLDPHAVQMYIVNDLNLNAFVAGGQNIFVNAGLFLELKNPNELTGVLAHETGHMAAGHLSRGTYAMSKATIPMLLSMIVGVGAMIAGAGEAGMVLLGLGQNVAEAQYMQFSRSQEGTADQMGQRFLRLTHQSGRGMVDVFNRMANEEAEIVKNPERFATDHPASRTRVELMEKEAKTSPYWGARDTPESIHQFDMIRGKVIGYLLPVDEVLEKYPLSDNSQEARYARAMAYMRQPNLQGALKEIQSLIKDDPKNPYFYEVLGQIYVTMGQPLKGVEPFQKSVDLLGDAPEIRVSLAAAMIATGDKAQEQKAITHLKVALQQDSEQPFAWYEMAQAYSDLGNHPMADLATAELKYLNGNAPGAALFAIRARQALPQGSMEWQHANDILTSVQPYLKRR